MIIPIVAAFFSTLFFAVLFNVSKDELVFCGLVGALGWAAFLFTNALTNEMILSTFVAANVISILSHILAKIRKNPVTIFQISGIIPLVPGAGMYRTLYAIVNQDYSNATYYFFETLQIAGSIAVAIILVGSIYKVLNNKKLHKSHFYVNE